MKNHIKVSPKNCVGCELCAISCSIYHEDQTREGAMRIRIKRQFPQRMDRPFQPEVCQSCDKPKCVEACPQSALVMDVEVGQVNLFKEKCDGCGECVEVCPFHAIWVDPLRNVAVKCDLCLGDPQCVKFCQFKAIESPFTT